MYVHIDSTFIWKVGQGARAQLGKYYVLQDVSLPLDMKEII